MLATPRQEGVTKGGAAPQAEAQADQDLSNRVGPSTDPATASMLRDCHIPCRMSMMPYHKVDVWSVVKEGLAEMASRGSRRAREDEVQNQQHEAFGHIATYDQRMPSGTSNPRHLKSMILLGKAPHLR